MSHCVHALSKGKVSDGRAIVSTYYLKVKFLIAEGDREVLKDQNLMRYCYNITIQGGKLAESYPIEGLDTQDELIEEVGV